MQTPLAAVCFLIFISCGHGKNEQPQNNVPQALQVNDKKSGSELFSKRPFEERDLVNELYEEKIRNDQVLSGLDELFNELRENKMDSLESLTNYSEKNDSYYKSANSHLKEIQDSILKKEIETVLEASVSKYNVRLERLTALKNALNRAELSARDRHTAVKLLVTLRMMKLYQENEPSSNPIESMLRGYNDLNKKLDSVINENK